MKRSRLTCSKVVLMLFIAALGALISTQAPRVEAQSPCPEDNVRLRDQNPTETASQESGSKPAEAASENKKEEKEPKWDVEAEHGPSTTIEFDTDEGTWMNLDLSPDGKQIVFDLLGDIYTIPITGGEAKLLSGGSAWDMQPRYSPDGKEIAFISDRAGGDNVWLMNSDGSNRRALTKETFRLLSAPQWMPDGDWIIVRKHFTGTRSLGAGEVWLCPWPR